MISGYNAYGNFVLLKNPQVKANPIFKGLKYIVILSMAFSIIAVILDLITIASLWPEIMAGG